MNIHPLISAPAAALLALTVAVAPAFAQGAYQSPPAPNAANSMPQAVDSAPPSARTLAPGTTGTQRTGTIATTRTEPGPTPARTRHLTRR